MPLPRMTTRRWMIAVAVVGIAFGAWLWVERRRVEFERLAYMYGSSSAIYTDLNGKDHWNAMMWMKYERAARYPFLPVLPDPPEPN